MGKIALGAHAYLRGRNSTQRTAVLDAAKTMLAKGGDLVIREDLYWSDVQPTETGGYDWTIPDAVATAAADKGYRMWWILSHPPRWATAPGAPNPDSAWPAPPYPDVITGGGNNALAAYVAFCRAAAERYAQGGAFWNIYAGIDRPTTHFEIWNEEYAWIGSQRWVISTMVPQYSSPDLYAAIYNAAAAAIWDVPYALPIAAVTDKTWNSGTPGAPYLDPFLAHVTVPLGGVSVHPYTLNYVPASFVPVDSTLRWQYFTQVPDIRAKLNAAGHAAVDMHITEMGWPSKPGALSEAEQAGRFTDLWTTIQALGYIKSLFLINITNPDWPDNPGLPNYDATNQECFYALWHTGSGVFDLGGVKPAVATITALPAITSGEPVNTAKSQTFFTLDGPLFAVINDTIDDQYTDPDEPGLTGTVTAQLVMPRGQLLLATGLTPPVALEVSEKIVGDVQPDGSITVNDGPMRLLACTDIFNLDVPFQYHLTFEVYNGATKRRINSFNFQAPDTDIIKRIAELSPVPSANPEGITKGDKGDTGKTLHWEQVIGGYQQFDDDGNAYGVIVTGLSLVDADNIDGGTPSSTTIAIIDGGTP